jgi:ClpP class serine protease
MLVDMSKALAQGGIAINIIQHGARKADGNPYEALPKAARERFQADIDAIGDIFASTVARNRRLSKSAILDMEAATYMGAQAVKAGLADAVMAPAEAFRALSALVNAPTGGAPATARTPGNARASAQPARAKPASGLLVDNGRKITGEKQDRNKNTGTNGTRTVKEDMKPDMKNKQPMPAQAGRMPAPVSPVQPDPAASWDAALHAAGMAAPASVTDRRAAGGMPALPGPRNAAAASWDAAMNGAGLGTPDMPPGHAVQATAAPKRTLRGRIAATWDAAARAAGIRS